MSLLQNEDFIIYQLRTSYLNCIKDGVGERLISINSAVLNDPGFRAAGWNTNPADAKRSYSPPIPTAITSDYFQVPPRSAGLPPPGFGEDEDEGGMVTGGGSHDTVGPGPVAKRRRRREQHEEEDSSDLSDESDEEAEATQRAAQQIRFAKMPIRTRSGSSPISGSNLRDGPSVLVTSPSRPQGDSRLRRGSLGAVEAVKERARRDTTTSSDMSSENELDPSVFKRKQINPNKPAQPSQLLAQKLREDDEHQSLNGDETQGREEDDSDNESVDTTLSSEFGETADSASLLEDVEDPLMSSPIVNMPRPITPQNISPKKTKSNPPNLQALPPARPISMVQPISELGLAIKARKKKPTSPFEAYATLSGKGDPNPLRIKVYAPFSKNPTKPFELLLRRTTQPGDCGERQVTVSDAIGLSLWRYAEEAIAPPIAGEQMNVNKWTLRMTEDGEVDFDFPALDRVKPVVDFTLNNNRGARARSRDKPYDEFALVEATKEQYADNEALAPTGPEPISSLQEDPENESGTEQPPQTRTGPIGPRTNPVLGLPFASSTLRNNGSTPADTPAMPTSHATPRTGASKILKIHFTSANAHTQTLTIDVTTDTYIAEVLDTVCRKWNFDRAHHILKVSGTNTVAPLDRTVEAIGGRADLDLIRKRFGNDGPLSLTGSPGSTSPNAPLLLTSQNPKKGKKAALHPLAQNQDFLGNTATYKRYNVVRKQPMSFTPSHPRILAIDGEYIHIMPGDTGKTLFDTGAKTSTIHFSSVVGCKVSRRHPKTFRVVVYKERESKRYDFEAQSVAEAAEIVSEVKKGIEPFNDDLVKVGGIEHAW
ncbi:MAG: hypothetical protein M1836_000959 [Candelina mexicana]|nr:MAG: hypothetical protein M1836_000959 [Candelina mexicana]